MRSFRPIPILNNNQEQKFSSLFCAPSLQDGNYCEWGYFFDGGNIVPFFVLALKSRNSILLETLL